MTIGTIMRKVLNKNICIRLSVVALLMLVASSCRISYKFNGAALDYNVYHTIRVSEFPIRAALVYPPLQQTFENELLDYITRNTRLQTVDGAVRTALFCISTHTCPPRFKIFIREQ